MDWIIALFQTPKVPYIGSITHSFHIHTVELLNYSCSYSCPGAQ